MAALMVADELVGDEQKMRRLEEDIAALQDARVVAADRAQGPHPMRWSALSIPRPSASKASPESSTRRSATAAACRSADVFHGKWRARHIMTTFVGRGCGVRQETQSPGPYRSLRELSLAGLVGSVIWRPPTYVGTRDRRSNGHRGSALILQ